MFIGGVAIIALPSGLFVTLNPAAQTPVLLVDTAKDS
jgi:hypothetical protein